MADNVGGLLLGGNVIWVRSCIGFIHQLSKAFSTNVTGGLLQKYYKTAETFW
jgi:hypothetical protein